MSKKGYIILAAVLVVVIVALCVLLPVLFFANPNKSDNGGNSSDGNGITYISELNKSYEGDSLRLTATDFQVNRDKAFLSSKVTTTVSIYFEAENISDGEYSFSEDSISVYVDDTLYDAGELDSALFGSLMPGKKSAGEIKFEIPGSTNCVEVTVKENLESDKTGYASFKFEIPAVTETTAPADEPDIKDIRDKIGDKVDEYVDKAGDVVSDIGEYIDEHDGFVTDIKDYIGGIVSDIKG